MEWFHFNKKKTKQKTKLHQFYNPYMIGDRIIIYLEFFALHSIVFPHVHVVHVHVPIDLNIHYVFQLYTEKISKKEKKSSLEF